MSKTHIFCAILGLASGIGCTPVPGDGSHVVGTTGTGVTSVIIDRPDTAAPSDFHHGAVLTVDELGKIVSTFDWVNNVEAAKVRQQAIEELEEHGHVSEAPPRQWIDFDVPYSVPSDLPKKNFPPSLVRGITFDVEWMDGAPVDDQGFDVSNASHEPYNLPQWGVNDRLLARTLPHVPDCRYIVFDGTLITDDGVRIACDIPCLTRIGLANAWIHRYPSLITNRSLVYVGAHSGLQQISINCLPITDEGISFLSASRSIRNVILLNCPITSRALIHLARMPNLVDLYISKTDDLHIAPDSYSPDLSEWSPAIDQAIRSMEGRLHYVELHNIPVHPNIVRAFRDLKSVSRFVYKAAKDDERR